MRRDGRAYRRRLIDAGYTVRLFDPRRRDGALVERGGVAANRRRMRQRVRVAFACLPSPEISREVAFGADGVVGGEGCAPMWRCRPSARPWSGSARRGAREPQYRHPRRAGQRRSARPQRAGTLSTMVAGESTPFERVKPMLQALARHVFYVGGQARHGTGGEARQQHDLGRRHDLAAFEASAMAVKAGVDARTLIETVNASTGRNSATMDKFPASVLTRSFDYGGKVSTMYKDLVAVPRERPGTSR